MFLLFKGVEHVYLTMEKILICLGQGSLDKNMKLMEETNSVIPGSENKKLCS